MGAEHILRYAHMAMLAYHDEIDEALLKERLNNDVVAKEYISKDHAQCWIFQEGKEMIVSFRGTDSLGDAMTNVNFIPVDFTIGEERCGRVHQGYYDYYKRLKGHVFKCIDDHVKEHGAAAELSFVGHSLGGCVVLCALEASYKYEENKENISVYTFGAPAVGNQHFRDKVISRIGSLTRVIYDSDIVPHLPLNLINVHVSEPLVIKDGIASEAWRPTLKCVDHHNMENYITGLKGFRYIPPRPWMIPSLSKSLITRQANTRMQGK